jgi:hypothetical protein
MPVEVDVDAPRFREQLTEVKERRVEPVEIAVEAAAPGIPVCLLLDEVRLSVKSSPSTAIVKEKSSPVKKGGSMYTRSTAPANSGRSDGRTYFLSPQMSRLRQSACRSLPKKSRERCLSWADSLTVSTV